jgi:hypothetical protein
MSLTACTHGLWCASTVIVAVLPLELSAVAVSCVAVVMALLPALSAAVSAAL